MSNFQPLEVVDRGSETQPQVVEKLNIFTQQAKGPIITITPHDLYNKICTCFIFLVLLLLL